MNCPSPPFPKKTRASLSRRYVFNNHLRDLDLSGMNPAWYVEASGLDGIGQTVELTDQEQAGGGSLSDLLGRISSLPSSTGPYDKGAGTLTYRSATDDSGTLAKTSDAKVPAALAALISAARRFSVQVLLLRVFLGRIVESIQAARAAALRKKGSTRG